MVARFLITLFTCCLLATSHSQSLDSIINIKPHSSIIKDTLYQGKHYNQIDFNEKGKVIAMGNVTKDGMKIGYWVYFSFVSNKQLCIGTYKNGLKNGWWYQNFDECNIKFKHGREVKKRYHF